MSGKDIEIIRHPKDEGIAVSQRGVDLPPENESSFMLDWKLRKGAIDGQEVLHARADYPQAA